MITITSIDVGADFLGTRIHDVTGDEFYICVDATSTELTVRLITWVMRVLMWNPCNDWQLVAGVK